MSTYIKRNQTLNVRKAVVSWLAHNQPEAEAILYGRGKVERISAHRLSSIQQAYEDGIEDQLPPVVYCPQFGTMTDGRHRLAVAYLRGVQEIKAEFHYCIPD